MPDLYIQGIKVGSLNEYNVAMALERMRLDFQYQHPIMGGHWIRGGQVLDFLVDRDPLPVPVNVQGEYWHANPAAEAFREIAISAYGKGQWDELVKITEAESATFESAYDAVRRKIR
jgi:hypothetical protein